MATFSVSRRVECPVERVLELAFDEAFLRAFVALQKASTSTVLADPGAGTATATWRSTFSGSMPGLLAKLVGDHADMALRITRAAPLDIELEVKAKASGRMTGTISAEPDGSGAVLTAAGDTRIGGLLGGQIAPAANGGVVVPVLRDELFPLFEQWRDGPPQG